MKKRMHQQNQKVQCSPTSKKCTFPKCCFLLMWSDQAAFSFKNCRISGWKILDTLSTLRVNEMRNECCCCCLCQPPNLSSNWGMRTDKYMRQKEEFIFLSSRSKTMPSFVTLQTDPIQILKIQLKKKIQYRSIICKV